MIHSESKTKAMGKKSNNINKYRMQFHLENKSLSKASSWVDCQQNLNRSLEKCHSALTHEHKRTQHCMHAHAVLKIYIIVHPIRLLRGEHLIKFEGKYRKIHKIRFKSNYRGPSTWNFYRCVSICSIENGAVTSHCTLSNRCFMAVCVYSNTSCSHTMLSMK